MEIFAAETAEAIENLTNATVQYQNTNQNLTTTNTTITNNMIEANHQLADALNMIATLQINGGNGGRGCGRGHGHGREGRGGRGGRAGWG